MDFEGDGDSAVRSLARVPEVGPGGAFLIGDPPTVAAKVLAASDMLGGVSRVTFQMNSAPLEHATMTRSIQLLGAEVAPAVRQATTPRPLVPAAAA